MITESMECPGSMLIHLVSGKRLKPNLVSDTNSDILLKMQH